MGMYDSAMRRITLIVMMMAVACGGPVAEEAPQAEMALSPQQVEQEVQQAERDWATSVMAKDVAKLGEIYHDRLLYAHSTGVVETKSEYMGKLEAGTTVYEVVEHAEMRVLPYGDMAMAHSRLHMKGVSADGPFDNLFMTIHVWVNEGGQWRLAAHQTTRLEAPE